MSHVYVFYLSRDIVSYKYINSHWLIGSSESLFPRLHQTTINIFLLHLFLFLIFFHFKAQKSLGHSPQQFVHLLQDIGGQHVAESSQKVWDFFIMIHIHVSVKFLIINTYNTP